MLDALGGGLSVFHMAASHNARFLSIEFALPYAGLICNTQIHGFARHNMRECSRKGRKMTKNWNCTKRDKLNANSPRFFIC